MVVLATPETPITAQNFNLVNMNVASFLHCNACYHRPGIGPNKRLFLTNCSHIFCETCVTAATKDACKVCKSPCSTLELSNKLPKEVEHLFIDPHTSLLNFLKDYIKRCEFQASHSRRLLKHMTNQMKEVHNIIKKAQKLEKEFAMVKSQNEYLMKIMPKNNTPRSGSRSATSPQVYHASPSQLSPAHGKFPNHGYHQNRSSGGSSYASQINRVSIRTPPSGGRPGTIGGTHYNSTPGSTGRSETMSTTPLTIPRPIQFK